MKNTINSEQLTIRTDIRPGDLGMITYLHGKLYSEEYHYNSNFEKYVATGLQEFLNNFNDQKDRLWIVEAQGQIVGSIVIMGRSGKVAQLRYFILLPAYRGIGLGKKLMQLAMDFCKATGYTSVYLWTANELHTAAHLYRKFGFQRTQQVSASHWGKDVMEDCYDTVIE